MKTYHSLSIDVIHFDAQDVITTSCICEGNVLQIHTGGVDAVFICENHAACPAPSHKMGSYPYHVPKELLPDDFPF